VLEAVKKVLGVNTPLWEGSINLRVMPFWLQ